MTTSPPPDGPSRDLRERLIRALYVATWDETFEDWADAPEIEIAFTGSQVDAVLAEIEASGYCIVPTDRLDRLMDTTAAAKEFTDTLFLMTDMSNEQSVAVARELGVRIAEAVLRLQPGDLDPIDPVAPGEGER